MKATRAQAGAAQALAHLRRIVHAIHAQSAAIEAALGLSGPQLWALRELAASGHCQPTGYLASCLAIHKASAGRLVDRLEERALVRRDPDPADGRVVLVSITARGRRLARRRVRGPVQAELLTRLEQLAPGEVAVIARALARVEQLLGAEGLAPTPLFEPRGWATNRSTEPSPETKRAPARRRQKNAGLERAR